MGKGKATAGYSGKPLAAKLGLRDGQRFHLVGAPQGYLAALAPPAGLTLSRTARGADVIQLFVTRRADLDRLFEALHAGLAPGGMIWVSWPKAASGVPSDVREETVREVALPRGFVDVKVCAVDETWSGLKLVRRRPASRLA